MLNLHISITDRPLKTACTDILKWVSNTVRETEYLWNPQDTACIIYERHETAVFLWDKTGLKSLMLKYARDGSKAVF